MADGYETAVQWVPSGSRTVVQDLQTRRIRPIRPGQSVSVVVEPTSSLCTDLEDAWRLDHRCEVVHIEATAEGRLVVEARDPSGGTVAPEAFFFATSGSYVAPWTRTSPSTLSVILQPGLSKIFIGVPDGASRRFTIATSFQ